MLWLLCLLFYHVLLLGDLNYLYIASHMKLPYREWINIPTMRGNHGKIITFGRAGNLKNKLFM